MGREMKKTNTESNVFCDVVNSVTEFFSLSRKRSLLIYPLQEYTHRKPKTTNEIAKFCRTYVQCKSQKIIIIMEGQNGKVGMEQEYEIAGMYGLGFHK